LANQVLPFPAKNYPANICTFQKHYTSLIRQLPNFGITTLTFDGHMTSSMTSSFDLP